MPKKKTADGKGPKANKFAEIVTQYVKAAREKFRSAGVSFNPEDQLKPLVGELFADLAGCFGVRVKTWTEIHTSEVGGRPDIGVAAEGLLTGFVELKRPGKGANPQLFKGPDKKQWDRFRDLPNLIYTDGTEWTLFRSGEKVSSFRFAADVTTSGLKALQETRLEHLEGLLRDFIAWSPVVPTNPRALADMLARLCRLLREQVTEALEDPESNLSSLAVDWKKYFFPDADNRQFADAYAQTVTYALLLGRLSGEASLTIDTAVSAVRKGHRLLGDALRVLGDPAARDEIKVPLSLLERATSVVDPQKLLRKSKGDP